MNSDALFPLCFQPSLELLKTVKAIHARIERLAVQMEEFSEDERTWLSRWSLISNVGASTRIENAVLTDPEVEWVDTALTIDGRTTAFETQRSQILNKLSKDRERSIEEVVGCREMMNLILLQADELYPLTETAVRGLHDALLCFYPAAGHYAGRYKTTTNQVVSDNPQTGERRIVLDPTPPGPQTESAMRDLVDWYNGALHKQPWPLLTATEFVFRFFAIHPFQDGNGRLGRGLFLLTMLQADDSALTQVSRIISLDRQIEKHRPMYYTVLHQASGGRYLANPADYNMEPLAWFFLKMMDAAISDVEMLRTKYRALQRLSESANTVLACFRSLPERKLKASEIVTQTELARRTVQNSLTTLLEGGFIQRQGVGPGTRYQLLF